MAVSLRSTRSDNARSLLLTNASIPPPGWRGPRRARWHQPALTRSARRAYTSGRPTTGKPLFRHWLSQCLRPRTRQNRRRYNDAWRLLLGWLLRNHRRTDRRDLCTCTGIVLRESAIVPDTGLSIPHDPAEPDQAPRQSKHAFLEDAERGQRSLRGDASRTQGRRL